MATILYIEDNPDNKLLVQRVVEAMGHIFMWAEDGLRGLAQVAQQPPDLILLDINLPDIDGYEVARRVRAEPAWAGLPIVALTANALKGDDVKVLEAGCDGYISKPLRISDLRAQINHYLALPKA
jgi:two-component system cell cycle response regulator DivK